jgi:hypothetical protein
MRRPRQMLTKEPGIYAAFLCMAAALPGCSAASPAAGSSPAAVVSPGAVFAFTIAGARPVPPNGSQDTHTQTPKAACDSATFAADEDLGGKVADGFAVAGFPASADLLTHFLEGKGTGVDYRAGSPIAAKAVSSSAFQAVNNEVQRAILIQLKAGKTRVQLAGAQLPTVAFESKNSDLYWGFRGTQGLTVTGSGSRKNGRYAGTLSYVIRDSYGFPASDTLHGFGAPMRYLQTACGAPQHPGGAHWFPDTITVIVPFSQPAPQRVAATGTEQASVTIRLCLRCHCGLPSGKPASSSGFLPHLAGTRTGPHPPPAIVRLSCWLPSPASGKQAGCPDPQAAGGSRRSKPQQPASPHPD